jgi:suppressor for copper-sensitivity B
MKSLTLRWTSLPLALAGFSLPLHALSSPWFETPQGRVRLLSAWKAAPQELVDPRLGLEFELQPGWHVYWKNPGDAGYAPVLEAIPPTDLEAVRLRYPAPQRFLLPGGLEAIGYEDTVVYPLEAALRPQGGATSPIRLRLEYLICADTCIPYRAELGLELPRGQPVEDLELGALLSRWEARVPIPLEKLSPPLQVSLTSRPATHRSFELFLRFSAPSLRLLTPDLFLEPLEGWEASRAKLHYEPEGPAFRIELRPLEERPLPEQLPWTLTGIELAGRLVAVEGRSVLSPPASKVAWRPRWALAVVAAGLLLAALGWILARSRRQSA